MAKKSLASRLRMAEKLEPKGGPKEKEGKADQKADLALLRKKGKK